MLSHQLKLLGNSANKHLLIHRPRNIQAQADLMVKHIDFWLLETIYLYCSGTSKFFPAPKARIALVYKTFSSWQNRQCKEMKSWLGAYVSWISIIWSYSVKGQKPKLFPIPIPANPNLGPSMVPWWPSLWWIYGPERWVLWGTQCTNPEDGEAGKGLWGVLLSLWKNCIWLSKHRLHVGF